MSLLKNIAESQDHINTGNIERYDELISQLKGQAAGTVVGSNSTQASIEAIESIKASITVERNDLYSVCPILLYQLTTEKRDGCITSLLSANKNHKHHVHIEPNEANRQMGEYE